MEEPITENSFKKLINDINFEEIELGLKNPNIFRILNISKTEIRHSNFLSWLLDPYESHNLRDAFLKRFLSDISVELDLTSFETIEIRREWRNIDILIITGDIVVCIENKVESNEHSDQLSRYKRIVRESFPSKDQIFVYLTPKQSEASDKEYISYSYEQIASILDRMISLFSRNITSEVLQYIKDYIEILKLEIMQNHEFSKLAIQLYNRHKDTFDFIFENRPDIATFFSVFFKAAIEENGWIICSDNKGLFRFLTPKLKSILPEMGGGWSQKDSFGFELDYYWYNQKQIVFKTTISPGEGTLRDERIREIILNCLSPIEGSQKPKGKKWLVPIIKKEPFSLEKISENEEHIIRSEISKIFLKLKEVVFEVENAILLKSEELKSFKESAILK
jgi:hypothetical protein